MISRRVHSWCSALGASRAARQLPRPLFIRAFSEQKESPTQPFNHTEEKMKVDEKTTENRANSFTAGFFTCLCLGLPASIYFGDYAGLTPKGSNPGPGRKGDA
jgi:hypothetical protein